LSNWIDLIDINFDVRSDAHGKDPDKASATLRQYHKLLWSKTLPGGQFFMLDDTAENTYLYHNSDLGEFPLSSDSIIHTYRHWKRTKSIIEQVPVYEMDYFYTLAYTVGGFIIFPGNRINNLPTLNQERGTNKKINDRIDLTLECIRLFYRNEQSPLFETIARYESFFLLFENFRYYCEYFLLQDLVACDFSSVNFFLPFTGFEYNPLPKTLEEYSAYRVNNINFLVNRNERIQNYSFTCKNHEIEKVEKK
jgi:hypothetical protein